MNRIIHSIVALLLWAFIPLHLSGAIRYVKPGDASTAWQGKENVYSDLQEALAAAVEGDEIWVAAGTYKPTTGTDRTISFELKNGVKLYGGFTGSEASREERNWYTNQTILSGDIGLENEKIDNSYHVVLCQLNEGETTWLDGFIVEKGFANYYKNNQTCGGGLYQSGGELTIVYCWFRYSFAGTYGGANFQESGVTKCYASVFSNNRSREAGIAIFNSNDYTLVNSVVSNNISDYDASAIYVGGYFIAENVIVDNNSGGIDNYGSINYSCFSEQINGTGNIVEDPIFLHAEQNDFRLINSSPCIGTGSSSNLPDWLTKDFQGNKLVSDDGTVSMGAFAQPVYVPQVVAPVNKQIYERGTQNVSLEWQWDSTWPDVSTAFDLELKESGQSEVTIIENASSPYQLTVAAGQNWQWRVRNVINTLKGEWSQFHQFFVPSDQPLFVKVGGAGSGTSWNNAYGDLQLALQQSVSGDEIWVAAGTYKPTTSDDVNISFELKDGVKLYGGFIGTETNLEERDWNRNKTILSGDIGIAQDYEDNSSHVISAIGAEHAPIGEGTELNGFVVTNGYAAHWEQKLGSGGGLYCKNAAPCFRNVLFLENRAKNDGGAVGVFTGSAPEFFNCLFVKNLSYMGAGAYVLSSASFYNCLWYKNETRHLGGRYKIGIEGQAVDIYNDSDMPLTIGNSVIALTDNNSGAFNAMYGESNNVNTLYTATPGFVNALDYDFRLNRASVCLDSGNNELAKSWPTDYSGGARIQNGTVDIGPFEGANNCPVNESPLNDVSIRGAEVEAIINFKGKWDENPSYTISRYFLQYWNHPESITTVDISSDLSYSANFNVGQSIYWRIGVETDQGVTNYSEVWRVHVPHVHPIYVKSGMTGDGSSWSSALGDLNEALNQAVTGDQIWVAAGTYETTTGTDRTISFELKDGVKLFGGFAGTESSLEERNWYVNQTILSGDIGIKDDVNDNSFHVVVCQLAEGEEAWLDGFILEKGNANKWTQNQQYGGGLYQEGGHLTVAYCWFRNNFSNDGSAFYGKAANTAFYCSLFSGNCSDNGMIIQYRGESNINLVNAVLSKNYSPNGRILNPYDGMINCVNTIEVNNEAYYAKSLANYRYSCMGWEDQGDGNINADPIFVDPEKNDFRLIYSSPCLTSGIADDIPEWMVKDFRGDNLKSADGKVPMGIFGKPVYTPLLISPADEEVLLKGTKSTTLDWKWEGTKEGLSYDLEYRIKGIEGSTVQNGVMPGHKIPVEAGKSYQWRIRANFNGEKGEWSPYYSFYIPFDHPIYVKVGATGDGTSWTNALSTLYEAISMAVTGDEIWVAEGIYKPTDDHKSELSFEIRQGIKLYGGFKGTETELNQRNWHANPTILSGDINEVGNNSDNSYHVVNCNLKEGEVACLDGFIIEKGYSIWFINGDQPYGNGLFLTNGELTVANCWFRDHFNKDFGAAIYSSEGVLHCYNTVFTNNSGYYGSALFNSDAQVDLGNVVITNNESSESGAVYGSFRISNSIIAGNSPRNIELQESTVSYSLIEEGYDGEGNITGNPYFVDPDNGDFRLNIISPCINAGSNDFISHYISTDYAGNKRIQDEVVDMGVFEGPVNTPVITSPLDNVILNGKDVDEVDLTWKWKGTAPVSVTGYDIQIWEDGGWDTLKITNVAELTYPYKLYEKGKVYHWRVRGVEPGKENCWTPDFTFTVTHNSPIYVKQGATGRGSSWNRPFGTLQEALEVAVAGDEIWVAQGIYNPTSDRDRSKSFMMKEGVKVYGGFRGSEEELEWRNWQKFKTILSGDIGEVGVNDDNSYQVVHYKGTENIFADAATVLDGFIIEQGYADQTSTDRGAGIWIEQASPYITNCFIRDCYANYYGGGIFIATGSSPVITNSLFVNIDSDSMFSTVYHDWNDSKFTTMLNCVVYKCRSGIGGNVHLTNSIVWNIIDTSYYDHIVGSSVVSTNNCIGDYYQPSITKDPLFVDPVNGNFHLKQESPCIGTGLNDSIAGLVVTDADGISRIIGKSVDIGMYEYAKPLPIAPVEKSVVKPRYNLYVDYSWQITDGIDTIQPERDFTYKLKVWNKADPTEVFEDISLVMDTWNSSEYRTGVEYNWTVGLSNGDYTTWSDTATFYMGHDHIIYVKEGAKGSGTSWSDAFGTLHEALDYAITGDEIWVAAGTYYPVAVQDAAAVTQTEQETALCLKPVLRLIGGFNGTETDISQRKFAANPTIISGDIGVKGDANDNSFRLVKNVFTAAKPMEGTVVDGFIFEQADNTTGDGGAMYNEYASPIIKNSIFCNNKAVNGGAVANKFSDPLFYNVLFHHNEAQHQGGAIHNDNAGETELINCTLGNNKAETMAAVKGYVSLVNCIVYHNEGITHNMQIHDYVNVNYSCVEGEVYEGEGNTVYDPQFVDAANGDYRLGEFSSCIDKGNRKLVVEPGRYDLAGSLRTIGEVDMGAFEAVSRGEIKVVSITPELNAKEVDYMEPIVITFNQPVVINDTSALEISPDIELTFMQSIDKKQLTLTHNGLNFGQSHTLFIDHDFAHFKGNDQLKLSIFGSAFTVRECRPVQLSVQNSVVSVCESNGVEMNVSSNGDIIDHYKWIYNDNVVAEGKGVTGYSLDEVSEANVGLYIVELSDQCGNTATQQIEVKFKETTPLEVRQKWDNVLLVDNASGQFSDFNWYFNDAPIETRQYVALNSGKDGEVYVTAVDKASGCKVTSEVKTIRRGALKSMTVSPNPAKVSQTVSIVLPQLVESGTVRMYDLGGHLVVQRDIADQQVVDFTDTNVTPGVYIVEVQTGMGVEKRKLVIEN